MWYLVQCLLSSAAVVLSTAVLGVVAVAAALVARSGRPIHALERVWARWIVRVCGMRLHVEGREHIDPQRSYVIISNHQSHLDICATMVGLNRKILFVAKRELLKVPIFGQALGLSDHIVIDRNDPKGAIATVNAAVSDRTDGSCFLFYAEGTRSPDGKLQPFKKGGAALALRTGLPILPLTVIGTRKFLPKGSLLIRPHGEVRIRVAPPIETAGRSTNDCDDLNEQVRSIILHNLYEQN